MDTVRMSLEPHAPETVRNVVRDRLDMFNVAATGHADWASLSITDFSKGRDAVTQPIAMRAAADASRARQREQQRVPDLYPSTGR